MRTRILAALAAAGSVVLLAAGPASAHVTIDPNTAAKGDGDIQLMIRVPNEESSSNTVSVQVAFPTDHPIASVLAEPVPGWTINIQSVTLATPIKTDDGTITQAVSMITWTGGQIAPGQFQAFPVMLGQLPDDTDQLAFKAIQTYANGDVVRWIDLQQPGQPEPDHPAPILTLTAAAPDGSAPSSTAPAGVTVSSAPAPAAPAAASASSKSSNSQGLAVGALVVGILALLAGGAAWMRAGRPGQPAPVAQPGKPSGDGSDQS